MDDQGISRQAVSGSVYSIISSSITLVLGAARGILLARLLLPEHFGVIALALVFINLVRNLRNIGLEMAIIHRQDVDEPTMRTYFSLRTGLDIAAAALLILSIPLMQWLYPQTPEIGQVLGVLTLAFFISSLSQVQETLLRKNLNFKSLATTDVAASLVMTIVAPYLAWQGWGVWALAAEQVSGVFTRFLMTWGPFRQWRAALGWDRSVAEWLWGFSKPTWVGLNLNYYLERFAFFWISISLGDTFLGYYSKAFEFANYPTRLIARQLITVFTPIFARVQQVRSSLSNYFYHSAYIILRAGAFVGGALALVLPEFIHYVIGDKWLPLLWIFRLMLLYVVLEPLLALMKGLFLATGQPQEMLKTSAVQAIFFTPAVILGAMVADLRGIALAVNGMVLVGIWKAYSPLRRLIDFSLFQLIGKPFFALAIALAAGLWVEHYLHVQAWLNLLIKISLYFILFTILMLIMEGRDYIKGIKSLWNLMRSKGEIQEAI